ncbi:molybdopterin-dependent oxidoreductase [soil metagenome]
MASHEALSFCRMCPGGCGVSITLDEDDRILSIRGDKEHPLSKGYACFKGLNSGAMHNGAERILRPLKRQPDGSFAKIPFEQAMDEIAERMAALIEEEGPDTVASYLGTAGFSNALASTMLPSFMRAVGSRSQFSAFTIDQSAKMVTAGRLGAWAAGKHHFDRADVWMIIGNNPIVSIAGSSGVPNYGTQKAMRDARARGMKIIVVDPRRSETAAYADIHLQLRPGEDTALLGGLIHVILAEGLEDKDFCARYVDGLDDLKAALSPLTPDAVEKRTGVPADQIVAAARMFAAGTHGCAGSGTGLCMSPYSNLAEHMVETLNVLCGRYPREGDQVVDPGVLFAYTAKRAEVMAPARWWEKTPKSRARGFGMLPALMTMEMMSGTLAEEILEPGPGRIRMLLVSGGNPASAVADQRRIVDALRSLDLLVAIEPVMTVTAQLADYIIPPTLQYERDDWPIFWGLERRMSGPFAQYARAVAKPPAGAEVVDDWRVYWALTQRLGKTLNFAGVDLDMTEPPRSEYLLGMLASGGKVPFEEIKGHERGAYFDVPPQYVEPAAAGNDARFCLLPDDVAMEFQSYLGETAERGDYAFLLTVRRMRDAVNSVHDAGPIRARHRYNPAYLHPLDLADLDLAVGDAIVVRSAFGEIPAIVEKDDALLRGMVQMAHCWGALPDSGADYAEVGSNPNLLIDAQTHCETINAMPHQSAVPVAIERRVAVPA